MRKNKILFGFLLLCVISSIILTGCNDDDISSEDNKEKVLQELDYLDTQIVSILNKLNNITLQNYTITSEEVSLGYGSTSSSGGTNEESTSGQSGESTQSEQKESNSQSQSTNSKQENNVTTTQMEPKAILESNESDVDWKNIKSKIETINNAWGIILLDLSSLNIDSKDALNFSTTLDECILNIKDENKKDSLANLAKLYSFIPKYENSISAPNNVQNAKKIKAYLINAYSFAEQDDWNQIETNISECEATFKNIINDLEYIKDKEYKVNKTYILIKELQNSLSYKDKKLFYIKYKNLLEAINTL